MNPVAEDEVRLVAAAREAAAGLVTSAPDADWMSFCVSLARGLYPLIDRGESLDAVRAALAGVTDACVRLSSAPLAHARLMRMLGSIRMEEELRTAGRHPGVPKARLADVVPPAAGEAMDAVWAEELDAFRRDSSGY